MDILLQVVLPFGLHREVDSYLRKHLSRKALNKKNFHNAFSASNVGQSSLIDESFEEQEKPSTRSAIAEKIILRRSSDMLNKQQHWQVSIAWT